MTRPIKQLAVEGGMSVRDTTLRPWTSWPIYDETEERALLDTLHSGQWWSGGGGQGKAFTREFAAYQGARHGSACASGTAALEVILRALGIGAGDEVIVPGYTFIATASAVLACGATPRFVDVRPDTLCMDAEQAEAAVTPSTRALLPVHIAGRPADLDALLPLARRHNLSLIEDAAQAHGAAWRGTPVGAIGDAGAFSFQASKNLNAGEGGFVLTNHPQIAERMEAVINVGWTANGERYAHPVHAGNYRLGEFQSAVLRAQMTRLPAQTARRQTNAAYLRTLLASIDGIELPFDDPRITSHAYHLFTFRYSADQFGGRTIGELAAALRAEGIPCSLGYAPLYKERIFTHYAMQMQTRSAGAQAVDYSSLLLPVCERLALDTLWLPQTLFLGAWQDMQDIAAALVKVRHAWR